MSAALAVMEIDDAPTRLDDSDLLTLLFSRLVDPGIAQVASTALIARAGSIAVAVQDTDLLFDAPNRLPAPMATVLAAIGSAVKAVRRGAVRCEGRGADRHVQLRMAGRWLRSLRERGGLSQIDVATRLNVGSYTIVDQIECGVGRVRWTDVPLWAEVLAMPVAELTTELLRYYEPTLHSLLRRPTQGACLVAD